MKEKKKAEKIGVTSKSLGIKILRPVREIVTEYCLKTGMDPQDIGFHLGLINGLTQLKTSKDDDDPKTTENITAMNSVIGLNQIFFYAGVMYALEHRDEIDFRYEDKVQLAKAIEDAKNGLSKALPSYFG
jgi:hypothetical protein